MVRLFLYSFVIFLSLPCKGQATNNSIVIEQKSSCVNEEQEREVRGTSMFGIFDKGSGITLLHNYYHCNNVEIGDIIVFNYRDSSESRDWIKQVYAKPGDTVTLQIKQGKIYLLVNAKKIYNYQHKPYKVNKIGASYIALSQQKKMKNNIIPRGHYLVLGTAEIGGWDSRRIGLIPHNLIIGKVRY